jgi:3-hydroxybutyryl-CoA dehydrogenase
LTVIRDSPEFIAQRILSMVINVSCEIVQQQIAHPRDIDAAVTLGLGYPLDPLAWGDEVGPTAVLTILERLQVVTGDMRYRPSTWLRRRAQLGMSLPAPEWSGA